jgi:polyisoprenoid-binding protein YceI
MKKLTIFGGILLLTAAFVISNQWNVVDAGNIVVNFKLNNEGTSGTFKGIEAKIDFDEKNLAKSSLIATIKVKTLSTENKARDKHLLSSDFFDQEKFPTITFTSNSITKTDSGFLAKGTLDLKGKKDAVSIPFTLVTENGKSLFKGTMVVKPSDYEVTKGNKFKDETVSVSVEIPLKK